MCIDIYITYMVYARAQQFYSALKVPSIVMGGSGYAHGSVVGNDPTLVEDAQSCLGGSHRMPLGGDAHNSSTHGGTCTAWKSTCFRRISYKFQCRAMVVSWAVPDPKHTGWARVVVCEVAPGMPLLCGIHSGNANNEQSAWHGP